MNETKENKLLNEIIASESKDWVNKGAAPGSEDGRQKTKDKRGKTKNRRQKSEGSESQLSVASYRPQAASCQPPVASFLYSAKNNK